ncbi:gluconokinase [Rhizobium sp. TRM95111]|uniref:gluconokinase n=1 Tax=Rhizobium alarense TaxID=2846851 RepID=UPI001F25AFB4|nr:gluconokinase [Rhizobium alarense]MCF3641791.1 gluconokinase [Rhizobium alarense]
MLLMGVAGCGKSTVGVALAERIGAVYLDGDVLHPPENIAKMSRGEPLDDADRWPWLTLVGRSLAAPATPLVVGCSALKRRYRDHIRLEAGASVALIHLAGSRDLIAARMTARTGHFMPAALVESQYAALEPPGSDENTIDVDIDQPIDAIIDRIARLLGGTEHDE